MSPFKVVWQKLLRYWRDIQLVLSQYYYGYLFHELLAFQLPDRLLPSQAPESCGWEVVGCSADVSLVAKPSGAYEAKLNFSNFRDAFFGPLVCASTAAHGLASLVTAVLILHLRIPYLTRPWSV